MQGTLGDVVAGIRDRFEAEIPECVLVHEAPNTRNPINYNDISYGIMGVMNWDWDFETL